MQQPRELLYKFWSPITGLPLMGKNGKQKSQDKGVGTTSLEPATNNLLWDCICALNRTGCRCLPMSVSASPPPPQKEIYSTLFLFTAFKNHPEYTIAADLIHPSLGKVLDKLYVTLARYIVVLSPNSDLSYILLLHLRKTDS